MRPLLLLFACTFATLPSCGADPDPGRAAAAFSAFQAALQRGDRDACRALLTEQSTLALDDLPWDRVRDREPLAVLGAERGIGDFRVHVRDPGDGGRVSQFVVVREYGRLVVDLVATAGLHTEIVEASGSKEEFVPRELSPADLDRIRQYELSQPRR
jgi:hypothetical protein